MIAFLLEGDKKKEKTTPNKNKNKIMDDKPVQEVGDYDN